MGESAPPLRLRGGGMMNDSGSSSDEDNYMSAAEELSLSPTPHYYETPALNAELNGGDLMDEKGDGKGEIENRNDPEEKLEDKGDAHTGLSDVEEELESEAAQPDGECTRIEKEMSSTFQEEQAAGENARKGGEGALITNDAAGGDQTGQIEVSKSVDSSDEDYEDKYSYRCLKRLDRDFLSRPRLIVRGIWRGEVLELQSKRRTEGTWVEWIMKDMKSKKTILLVEAKKCPIGPNLSNVPLN